MTSPAMRYLLLVIVALVALAAHAQTGEVTITSDFPVAGQDFPVQVDFTFDVEAVAVHLRPLASSDVYTEVQGQPSAANPRQFTGTIPGAHIRPEGVELFVSYVRDGVALTVPEVDPEQNPLRFPTLTLRLQADVLLVPRRYRMISIPFQFISGGSGFGDGSLASIFEDDFGPLDDPPTRWRVLRWQPEPEEYAEGDAAVPLVRPGEAFWLVTNAGGRFDVEGGVTPGFDFSEGVFEVPVRVSLEPGWNQVGNPYMYPIPWQGVENSGLVTEPFGFVGTSYVPGQLTLQPWTGYFVFNPGEAPVELRFRPPPPGGEPPQARPFAARYLEDLGEGGFLVQVVAVSGEDRDEHTYLGLSQEGELHDLRKPPAVADVLHVSVADDEGKWAGRISRPGEAASWTVRFSADWPAARPVTVSLAEHGQPPPGHSLAIFDQDSGATVPAPGGQFSFWLGGGMTERSYRVELVPANRIPVPDVADRLAPPYPNPSTLGTDRITVHAWAGEEGGATIDVLDLLGRRVAVLGEALQGDGWQPLEWDGRDAAGRLLPAGLYLIRYRSGATMLTRTITLL